LSNQSSLPREQPYKDLINLLNFILRQFFKAIEKDGFLAIEVRLLCRTFPNSHSSNSFLQVFFPKNRGHWKQFSSWEPGQQSKAEKTVVDTRFPPDVEVKKGYSWSDQLGIVVAALVEANGNGFVKWTTEESRPSMSFRPVPSDFNADPGSRYWAAFTDYRGN
jgi:replication fork protection complex subunit Tof1/Swi1